MRFDSLNAPSGEKPELNSRISRMWDVLTKPSSALKNADDQLKARLLASFLMFLIPLGIGLAALPSALRSAPVLDDPIFLVTLATCAALMIAYGFSRTKYYQVGTLLALLIITLGVVGAVIAAPDQSSRLMGFLLIPILLASMLLPIRMLTGLIVAVLLVIVGLPLVIRSVDMIGTLIGEFSLILITATMILMLLDHRHRVEHVHQRALAASEERYRQLVEYSPELVAVQRDGKFVYINPAGVELLGAVSASEIIGLPVDRILPPEDYSPVQNGSALIEGENWFEHKVVRLNGEMRDVEGHGTKIDYFGQPAYQTIVWDITERKQAELERAQHTENLEVMVRDRTQQLTRARDRAEAILNNTPDSMILLTAEGTIDTGNTVFYRMFEWEPDAIYQQPLSALIISRHHASLERAISTACTQHENVRLEVIAQKVNGRTFEAEIALAPIFEGERVIGMVCSLRDISSIKEIERLKDTFVSNVSHELRTPITSLKLYHQLLVMNPDKSHEYMTSLQREMTRLERIVEDLLLLSRLEGGRIHLDRAALDLNRLIEDYVTDRSPLAYSNELLLSFIPGGDIPVIYADRSLIGQVLSILMTNAFSYTPASGSVCVLTHRDGLEQSKLAGFTVVDTGPGIALQDRDRLFERFYRGFASRTVNAPGTGLGLAIAQEIIGRHNGHIEIDSPHVIRPDGYGGAMFTVWLPVQAN
jgi:PAS domain S-box-containing protein